jgi:peptidoglycan hydrolase-like protein with peptidoglycan-binding domain
VIRKRWVLTAAAVVIVATVIASVAAISSANQANPAAQQPAVNTAKVDRGKLSAMVSMYGTLTYRGQADGSPYSVINQARGTYTKLPYDGDKVVCGDVFYRVDDTPVLLLCGGVPAYRGLQVGEVGNDVRQLNQNLHTLGYDAAAGVVVDPNDNNFTVQTQKALQALQHNKGAAVTGTLGIGGAIFLPESVRIAKVTGQLGGSAQPGAQVLSATSDTLEVHVALDASQQGDVKQGDRARITLPGNVSVTGAVDRLGTVAQPPAGQNQDPGAATTPAYISLDDPTKAAGLDQAPVQVSITTTGVDNALSVPVTAIIGRSGGGFAVEVVRADGRHELVTVELGLYDATAGRVQVTGGLSEGDEVVVPSL